MMKNYRCWDPANARHVMNPDAEHLEPDVFLAVHSDHDLVLVDTQQSVRNWDDRNRWTKSAMDFVRDFLSPTRHQVQVAVLGQSGSGKSHFIHWLKLHIPESTAYYVLSIPKTHTSLRGILKQLMELLPPDLRAPYQTRLDMAGDSLSTPDERKNRLLSEIAMAIPHAELSATEVDQEAIVFLRECLPALFNDPHARTLWKRQGAVVEMLVEHIASAPQDYQRVEQRRAFSPDDMPLNAIEISRASDEARIILTTLLGNEELTALAVHMINASLNEAITRVLNFTGQQLFDLMLDVRRYLLHQGKGLILLIEDFAILQGIDVALLQSLNQSSGVGEDALCDLRWAMAVTRGYYDELPDTVKTRMDFVIDMDLPTTIMPQEKLRTFAARYLNAARLDRAELQGWYGRHQTEADSSTPPNHCAGCEFRDDCHTSFGATPDGIGFYPFNERALINMADRQDVLADDRFNPRRFIKSVLANVMDAHSDELVAGQFPSESLLQEMRGSRMTPQQAQWLSNRYPSNFRRLRAVQQLWGAEDRLVKLPNGLYDAFDLPIPELDEASAPAMAAYQPAVTAQVVAASTVIATPPAAQDKVLATIRAWSNGQMLPEIETRTLRTYVYDAICSFIDWDNQGFARTRLTKHFQSRYIDFAGQQTQSGQSPIHLKIPSSDDEDSRRQAALALEGLHRFSLQGDWNFEDGMEYFLALIACLEEWTEQLVPQFQQVFQATDLAWQPVDIAIGVLVAGAILAGKITSFDIETPLALDALFDKWGEAQALPPAWRSLYLRLSEKRQLVEDILRGWVSGTKGGQVGKMLVPHLIVPRLKQFLKNPAFPPLSENAAQGREYIDLVHIHEQIRRELPKLLQEELDYRREWYRIVNMHMGQDVARGTLVKAAKDFYAACLGVGISLPRQLKETFDETVGTFEKAQVDRVIRAYSDLDGDDPMLSFPFLARRPSNLEGIRRFLETLAQMKEVAEAQIQIEFGKLAGHDAQLKDDMDHIEHGLADLEHILAQMGSER
jgi:hypothetical protein